MGNNILSRNRKDSNLKVLILCEQLVKDIISMLNDESKFPKRQRMMFGSRFVQNALGSYECLRMANRIYPESKYLIRERYNLALEAEKLISSLVSDIKLITTITNTCNETTAWYNNIQMKAIECENSIRNWRMSETKRFKSNMSKFTNNSNNTNIKARKVVSFAYEVN